MNILLINPMSSRKQPIKGRKTHFPVGLGYLAAYLKTNNYNVSVFDNETECLDKTELKKFLSESDYDIYGITGMSSQYSYIKGLAYMIKKLKDKPLILGGPLATYSSDVVLRHMDIDACVIGEGEETIVDLLKNINNMQSVSGIAFQKDGEVVKTPPREYKKSRNDYPFPAYELFDMSRYLSKQQIQYEGWGHQFLNQNIAGIKNIGITTGIGCPYLCRFCSRSVIKPRLRSIDNIISEIKYCKKAYKIEGVRFLDDLLIVNEKRTFELCEKIEALDLVWSGQARTNTLNDQMAQAMKKSGCVGVGFGYETGSERILKAMNKGTTIAKHKKATLVAKNNNLAIRIQLLFGYPGENKESIEETIEFFREMQLPARRFNILTPLPGSELYQNCLNNKNIKDEDQYLTEVSSMNAGFDGKKVLINLTDMTDQEFEELLLYAENKMEENYKRIYRQSNKLWFIMPLIVFIVRLKKVFSKDAWKRKLKAWKSSSQDAQAKLSREEIDTKYFNLHNGLDNLSKEM